MPSLITEKFSNTKADPSQESTERLLAEEAGQPWSGHEDSSTDAHNRTLTFLVQMTTVGLFFLIGGLFGFRWRGDLDHVCSEHVSQYSPIMRDVGISYHVREFNGSLLHENIFRQGASLEVDAAWDALDRGVRVPPEDAALSGLAADQVKIREKYGGGFPAHIEGLYHLQCLNLLRQSLYYNYDYYHSRGEGAFSNHDYIVRRHVSHCLDILRQQLMCTVDTGVLGQRWIYLDHAEPAVNPNTAHRCKNFDAVRRWAKTNQLPEDPPGDFLEPPAFGDLLYPAMG